MIDETAVVVDDDVKMTFQAKSVTTNNDRMILVERRSMAMCNFILKSGLVEITKISGNFFKNFGHNVGEKTYLYPEEAVFLVEKDLAIVRIEDSKAEYEELYQTMLKYVPLQIHLAYTKLKILNYVALRHSNHVQYFNTDNDIYDYLKAHPKMSLLEAMVSFDIYMSSGQFKKRLRCEVKATGYVVVTAGDKLFSPRILQQLLWEAKGVPVIFAVMTSNGFVMLQEFTDAQKTLEFDFHLPQNSPQVALAERIAANKTIVQITTSADVTSAADES